MTNSAMCGALLHRLLTGWKAGFEIDCAGGGRGMGDEGGVAENACYSIEVFLCHARFSMYAGVENFQFGKATNLMLTNRWSEGGWGGGV